MNWNDKIQSRHTAQTEKNDGRSKLCLLREKVQGCSEYCEGFCMRLMQGAFQKRDGRTVAGKVGEVE